MPGAPGFQVLPMVRTIVLAGLAVLLPISLRAQGHAAMASGGHAMAAAPRPMAHAAPSAIAAPIASARIPARSGLVRSSGVRTNAATIRNRTGIHRNINSANRFRSPQCRSGVPGLGFDEAHLAAVCPNGVGTGGLGVGSGFYFPFFEGGYYMPGYAGADESAAANAQQQDSGDVDARDYYGRRVREAPVAPPVVTSQEPTPVADSDQYVFVRRDGTFFFAVAYAWENGTLRYVTSDGRRRNIEKDALDLDATQQFNEQRGFSFRLPA